MGSPKDDINKQIRKAARLDDLFNKKKAPAFNKGIQGVDPVKLLSSASPEHIKLLSYDNFALWAQLSDFDIDQNKFDFQNHKYLLPLYLDDHKSITVCKAAQTGLTVYQLLRLLYLALTKHVKVALFFPTDQASQTLSKDRLGPMIESHPELSKRISSDVNTMNLKQIQNIHGKMSSLYILYLGGRASKDSVPLDVISFDEVRLCSAKDISQALERISHSSFKYKMFASTVGRPGQDIHKYFLEGDQRIWTNKCNCPDGVILPDQFPDCVVEHRGEVYYRCKICKYRIWDVQNGVYIPHNPKADAHSYSVSQMASKFISPKELWTEFKRTNNIQEFYNAKLGRPYIDIDNQPLNEQILNQNIVENWSWANEVSADRLLKSNTAMGVDAMGSKDGAHVVIMRKDRDCKRVVHVEIIEDENPMYFHNGRPTTPFRRIHQLMKEYDVGMCIIDAMPNINEALELARAFPGKVFLAYYNERAAGKDMVKWGDRAKTIEAVRKGSKHIKNKYHVTLNRYSTLDYLLKEFESRNIRYPKPERLTQVVRNLQTGRFEAEHIVRTRFFVNLSSLIREKELVDEDTGDFRMKYVYVGGDPHLAHAANYCNIALERLTKRTRLFI